jgi:RNA polymerase sigma-70 factor (ECF subfamily)
LLLITYFAGGKIMTREEELSIIEKVRNGDGNAFGRLVMANQKTVYNLALRLTRNAEDAEDLSQEAFLKAYCQLDNFRAESRFSVWLYRLTYNLCIDFLRKRNRANVIPLMHMDEDDEGRDFDVPDHRPQPEEETITRETNEAIAEGIGELSPSYREILMLREVTGMSYAEIATTLALSDGTVKSRLSRARRALAKILIAKGTFPEGYRLIDEENEEGRDNGQL